MTSTLKAAGGVVLALVVAAIVGGVTKQCTREGIEAYRQGERQDELQAWVTSIQAQLPLEVQGVRITKVELKGKRMLWEGVVPLPRAQINVEMRRQQLPTILTKSVCSDPASGLLIAKGYAIEYRYSDPAGVFVNEYTVDDCSPA